MNDNVDLDNLATAAVAEQAEREQKERLVREKLQALREEGENALASRQQQKKEPQETIQPEKLTSLKTKLVEIYHGSIDEKGEHFKSVVTKDNNRFGIFGHAPAERFPRPGSLNGYLLMGIACKPDVNFNYFEFAPFESRVSVKFDKDGQPVEVCAHDTQTQLKEARQDQQQELKRTGKQPKYTKDTSDGKGFPIITQYDDGHGLFRKHTTVFLLNGQDPQKHLWTSYEARFVSLLDQNGQLNEQGFKQLTQAVEPYLEIFQKPQINLTSK